MRAHLVPVLCGALMLQGAFAASLERRSPVMTEGVETKTGQYWAYDSSKYPPQVPALTASLHRRSRSHHTPGDGHGGHGGEGEGEGGGDPNGGGDKLGTGEGNKRRSVTQATSDLIGVETKTGQYWAYESSKYPPQVPSLTASLHRRSQSKAPPGHGHGGEGEGEGGGDPPGGGNNLSTGEGNKRRSVTQASSDLITSEAEINHDQGHGDDGHTRQSEAPMLPSMPRPSH